MNASQQKTIWLGLMIVGVGLIMLLQTAPGTQAQGVSPPTATPNIPPPVNPGGGTDQDSNADDDDTSSSPAGANIEVHVLDAPSEAWSVVQWQDANGDWQTVEGWQGTLENGVRRWWVHPKDFDTGPFRWVVLDSPGGSLVAGSKSFTLPRFPNETVWIKVVYGKKN